MAVSFEDGLLLVADVSTLFSLVILLYKLRWFTGGDDKPGDGAGDKAAASDISLNTQAGLTLAHFVRYSDMFRKPKRTIEPLAKWAQGLPHWKQLKPKHLVSLHKAGAAYATVTKVFALTGMLAIALCLGMRRWSFPSLGARDPVPLHILVAIATVGAAGIHSFVLMEPTLKPWEVAKTASFLLEALSLFPQLIADRMPATPPAAAADEADEPVAEEDLDDAVSARRKSPPQLDFQGYPIDWFVVAGRRPAEGRRPRGDRWHPGAAAAQWHVWRCDRQGGGRQRATERQAREHRGGDCGTQAGQPHRRQVRAQGRGRRGRRRGGGGRGRRAGEVLGRAAALRLPRAGARHPDGALVVQIIHGYHQRQGRRHEKHGSEVRRRGLYGALRPGKIQRIAD